MVDQATNALKYRVQESVNLALHVCGDITPTPPQCPKAACILLRWLPGNGGQTTVAP